MKLVEGRKSRPSLAPSAWGRRAHERLHVGLFVLNVARLELSHNNMEGLFERQDKQGNE